MCGIIAIISNNKVKHELSFGLEKLEYRGYDSAGIATKENSKFKVTKTVGKVENLKNKLKKATHNGNIGIAHTRWATHGAVETVNAHPFENENWCLVHNGIINNYKQLKEKYNLETQSQTDSEVVLKLLSSFKKDSIEAVIDTANLLDGSYALALINKNTNDLYFAKHKSPLFITKTEDGVRGSSDVVCFKNQSKEFYRLEDGEFCKANKNEIVFYNRNKKIIKKEPMSLSHIKYNTSKENFSHFMEKEIFDTKNVVEDIYNYYIKYKPEPKFFKNLLKKINKIKLIACGTAYHSALIGADVLQKITRIESHAVIASEFNTDLLDNKTLCIFVSQSGETADTINALKMAKQKKCKTLGIVNVMHSTMSSLVDYALPVLAGNEIAVASTKAYSAQILVLLCFAHIFATKNAREEFYKQFNIFKNELVVSYSTLTEKLINHLENATSCFVLGRATDLITAKETALKIKEITYINCNALPSGELKHGSLALIDKNMPVIMFCTNKEQINKSLSAREEILAREGKVLLLSQFELKEALHLPASNELFMPVVSILPIQLASYKISLSRNINPDKPRNLAKSVTVE